MRNMPVILNLTGTMSLKEIEQQWLDCCGRSQLPKVGVYDDYRVKSLLDLSPSFMGEDNCYIVSLYYLWGHSHWSIFDCSTGTGHINMLQRIKEGVSLSKRLDPHILYEWLTTKQEITLRPCDANGIKDILQTQLYHLFE